MKTIDLHTESYGPLDSQMGDLYLPENSHPSVVCLLHGGFWRMPYGREQMTNVAQDLVARGFAVWNLEYRRLGEPDGGWPGTLDDVVKGIEYLAELVAGGIDLDLGRVIAVGHSAGGQLAFWAAAQLAKSIPERRVQISGVAGQAAVADLLSAFDLGLGGGAVSELLGGSPSNQASRYEQASPRALLPLGIPQLVIHGTADDVVPLGIARSYVQAARDAGDKVEFAELAGAGHMDYLNPSSEAHAALCTWLARF